MKCAFLNAVAIAASLGMVATASAQYQTNARYSSYGHIRQEAAEQESNNDVSPSDVVAPPNAAGEVYQDQTVAPAPQQFNLPGCDSGGNGACATGSGGTGCGVGEGLIHNNDRNVVFGLRGLVFRRNYEDARLYGTNAFGETLYSNDSDLGTIGGFEATLGVRNCNGRGWEINYWGLYPDTADVSFFGRPFNTGYTGLTDLSLAGSAVDQTFNTADTWRTYRDNDFQNVEFNLLRNAGCTQGFCGGTTNIEWLAGIRWFRFDESIRLAAFNSQGSYPPQTFYDLETQNELIGFQLGARADRCLGCGFSLALGCKFGVYNNDIYARQSINDGNGGYAVATAGPYVNGDYNLSARENEFSTVGEFDLGLNWQMAPCWRANVGYRVFGVTGVALGPDQIPTNFQNYAAINNIRSNGDLLLHGAYFGLEHAF